MQLTNTVSDTKETKLVHFSKVKRKKIIIFVNKKENKNYFIIMVSASSTPNTQAVEGRGS